MWTFLLLAVLVPVVGEAIRQVGPLVLASRPEFDDLMDGLTFGVISGVAFACFDTIVRYWDLLTGGIVEPDPGLWVSLIFLHGFVKPLLIGTATGIACAEYSGLGRGYDGFTPRYYRGLALAVAANIAFQAGVYLFAFVGDDTLGRAQPGLGTADPRHLDLAAAYGAARRSDGGRAGADGAGGGIGADGELEGLRPVRAAVAGSRGVLQRLRHGRTGRRTRRTADRPVPAGAAQRPPDAAGGRRAGCRPCRRRPGSEDTASLAPAVQQPGSAALAEPRPGRSPTAGTGYDDEEGRA